jgi:hypothetical protein
MPPSPHVSAQTVANMLVLTSGDGEMRELASGVDALYLSGHGYLSKGLLAQLEEERVFADRVSVPVPFELGSLTFGLAPHGWGKYRYCLDHETGGSASPPAAGCPRCAFSPGPSSSIRSGQRKRCDISPTWCDRSLNDWS